LYDKSFNKVFDEKYYENADEGAKETEQNKNLNQQLLKDEEFNEDEEKVEAENAEENQKDYELELAQPFKEHAKTNLNDQMANDGFDMWYACDECTQSIPVGKFHFDCLECNDFTFCLKCYKKNKTHTHKFKKSKVNTGEGPPENEKELLNQAYMLCSECQESLIDVSKRVFFCETCSPDIKAGDALFWCRKCCESTEHEHKRIKMKGTNLPGLNPEEETTKYLDGLFEEYHNLDCEDKIAGGSIKTKFRYTTVKPDDFGLTNEDIFMLDDKQLNNLVPLKKYRPYRNLNEDGTEHNRIDVNIHAVIHKKQKFKDEVKTNMETVKKIKQSEMESEKAGNLGTKLKEKRV